MNKMTGILLGLILILQVSLVFTVKHQCPSVKEITHKISVPVKMYNVKHDDPFVICVTEKNKIHRDDSEIWYIGSNYKNTVVCKYKNVNLGDLVKTIREYKQLKSKIKNTMKGIEYLAKIKE